MLSFLRRLLALLITADHKAAPSIHIHINQNQHATPPTDEGDD